MNQTRKPIETETRGKGRQNHLLEMQRAMVPMPKWLKPCLITFIIFYCLFVLTGVAFYGSDNAMNPVMTVAYCVYVIALLIPFLIRIPFSGVINPLVYLSLITLLSLIIRSTPTVVFGPVNVSALLDFKLEEISLFRAYFYILSALSVISMYAGFFLFTKFPLPVLVNPVKSRIFIIVPLGMLIAFIGLIVFMRLSGSTANHMLNILVSRNVRIYTSEIHGFGQYMILMGFCIPAVLIWYASGIKVKYKPHFWILFLGALAIVYLAGGKRSAVIFPIIMWFCVHIIVHRKLNMIIPVILVTFFIAFIGSTAIRRIISMQYGFTPDVRDIRVFDFIGMGLQELRGREALNPAIPIIARVPEEVDLLLGESYLMDILRFIPRKIWPDKPIGLDTKVGIEFWNREVGKPPGGMAEAYWNFHIPGIIVVYLFYGMGLRYLMSFYLVNYKNHAATVLYVITLVRLDPAQTSVTKWYLLIIPAVLLAAIGGYLRLRGFCSSEKALPAAVQGHD